MRYDDWLFRDVALDADQGECVAVTGTNGSGKSTLLRLLYGEEQPVEGTVRVAGTVPDERSAAFRAQVSVAFDDSAAFDELTPRQHLELLAGTTGHAIDIDHELGRAGLAHPAEVPAGHLSAGQLRRLLLVGATARPHAVLLLDEPERALDAAGRRWLADLVRTATEQAAVVLTSHDDRLVAAVADRVVTL
jgi:ABC-type multidrug transport system ATPase subunit